MEAQKPDPLAVDPYAEIFCRAVGGPSADVLDGKDPDHPLKTADFGEYFVNFQGARTKYFDEYFRRATDAGVRQVVILAAGLDSRAYRLDWPAGTTVFEMDRPQVLDFKREVLADQGAQPRAERREIAVDLRDDWPQALRDSGFDGAKPSAWIAEGLLIYLPASAQEQLFTGVDSPATAAMSPSRAAPRWIPTSSRSAERSAQSTVGAGPEKSSLTGVQPARSASSIIPAGRIPDVLRHRHISHQTAGRGIRSQSAIGLAQSVAAH